MVVTRQVLCPRVIGRDSELRTIQTALEATRDGHGGCIFVLGEAGVGKSRVAREAERSAQRLGMSVLWGRGVEGGTAVPYRPIVEALLSALRRDGLPEDRPELRPFLPILGRLIPNWRETGGATVDDSLVVLSEAVVRLLRVMAGRSGCLLVLEDLHWADSETLAVLEYMTANVATEALVLLATSRSETPSGALDRARAFQSQRAGLVLDLARLGPAAVREMARACLETAAVPAAVDRLLDASADGLPLLVEDLLAEWVGAGALLRAEDEPGWHFGQVVGPMVPISFAETVRRRQRLIGADGARVLGLAALLGRQFDWTLLPLASGLDEDRVLELLRAAVDAQLLTAEPGGFGFRHALTQAAVLGELLPVDRARAAARLLALLETAHPGLEGEWCERAAALATAAGDRLKAAQLLFASGRTSLTRGALSTAEATLEQARALATAQSPATARSPATAESEADTRAVAAQQATPVGAMAARQAADAGATDTRAPSDTRAATRDQPADVDLRIEIDEALLQVLSDAGKHQRVFDVGAVLLSALAASAARPVRSATVHLCIAEAAVAGSRLAEASEHLAHARQLDAEGVLEARIDGLAAHVAIDELRLDDAERLAQAALSAAERLDQPVVACEALVVLGRLARAYDLTRAEAAFERAYQLAEARELGIWRSRALQELGTIDMFRDASPRRLLEARELAVQSSALATVALVDGQLAAVYNTRFELDLSLAAALRALEAGRRYQLPGIAAMGLLFEAETLAYRGDRPGWERIIAELRQSISEDASEQDYFGMCVFQLRALDALVNEDRRNALRSLASAMEYADRLPVAAPSPIFGLWALLSTIVSADSAPIRDRVRTSWAMVQLTNPGLVAYADAVDLGRRGLGPEAAHAVAEGDRILAPASWYQHYGRRLLAEAAIRDGWGQPAVWLRAGLAFFDDHGFDAVSTACRSLLRKCGGPGLPGRGHRGVPEPFGSRGVTEREIDVLLILSDGVSNKEIGARLYLSPKTVEKHVPKTVEKHVASLMDKLDVRSRAQLATIASAHLGDRARTSWGKSRM